MQRKHKTTLLIDEGVWRRFQEEVMRAEGPRAVSAEVEKLLGASDLGPFLEALESVLPRPLPDLPSLEEVERGRPILRREVAPLIREERDGREDRLLGLQRDREALRRRTRH